MRYALFNTIITVIFVLVALGVPARAETLVPVAGPLYSDSANAILVFNCQAPVGNRMLCAISRTKIWKKENVCSLSTNHNEAIFSRGTSNNVWSHVTEPEGLCGEVAVSSFETSADAYHFWTFKTRNVVTIKNKTIGQTVDCSKFDENEYLYVWRNASIPVGCEFLALR